MSAGPVGHEMCEVDQLMGVTVSSGDSNGLRKFVLGPMARMRPSVDHPLD